MSDKTTCQLCGACCRQPIIEADALDIAREPRIALRAQAASDNADLLPESYVWILAAGPTKPCPFLRPDNRYEIYPTRPNDCVAMPPGGEQCQEVRRMDREQA